MPVAVLIGLRPVASFGVIVCHSSRVPDSISTLEIVRPVAVVVYTNTCFESAQPIGNSCGPIPEIALELASDTE